MKRVYLFIVLLALLIISLLILMPKRKITVRKNKNNRNRNLTNKRKNKNTNPKRVRNLVEFFSSENKNELFSNMMENHYKNIFPNNANRNAAGFRFFKYIYDNLASSNELFDLYNSFYCAVSGSIVSPDRSDNFSVLKVKELGTNKCVFGKYYRCCVPCNCDIMKYARVVKVNLEIPRGSENFYEKNLLTIGDPCKNQNKLPDELDKNVFKCNGNNLKLGYRVDKKGNITTGKGRLIVGVLYPINENEKKLVDKAINGCLTGTKRFLSDENSLQYGMGDIFVKLALLNDNHNYTHTEQDFCTN